MLISGLTTTSPSTTTGFGVGRADRKDRRLRRVQHGHELLDPEHAEVRDRERAVGEIVPLELAFPGAADEAGPVCGDLLDRLPIGVADHRHDEPVRRGDGDADVRHGEAEDLVAREVGVHRPMAQERGRRDLRQQVAHRRLRLAVAEASDEPLAQLQGAGHVDRQRQLEDRRLPRLGQATRDRLARRRQLDLLDLSGRRRDGGRRGRLRRGDGAALDIIGDDPAFGAAAGQCRDVDPLLTREPAGERGGLDPAVGAAGASATAAVSAAAVAAAASWPRAR